MWKLIWCLDKMTFTRLKVCEMKRLKGMKLSALLRTFLWCTQTNVKLLLVTSVIDSEESPHICVFIWS